MKSSKFGKPKQIFHAPKSGAGLPGYDLFTEDGRVLYHVTLNNIPRTSKEILKVGSHKKFVPKEVSEAFIETYGVSAKVVAKVAKGVIYKHCISKYPNWYKFATRGKLNMQYTDACTIEHAEAFEQACKDGIRNIAPLIALTGMSPKELKKELPASIWKKLCKNSYTHNRMIYQKLSHDVINSRLLLKELEESSEIPYSLWKVKRGRFEIGRNFSNDHYNFLRKCSTSPLKDLLVKPENILWLTKFSDTRRMALQLEQPFNPAWSPRRVDEEHRRLTLMQQLNFNQRRAVIDKEYAEKLKIDFRSLHKGLEVLKFNSGVTATPLLNMQEVQAEGSTQRHCVGSYAEWCADGNYLVYSLEKENTRTTLGIGVASKTQQSYPEMGRYSLSQHYGACNSQIDDKDFHEAVTEILKHLNEVNKEKQ